MIMRKVLALGLVGALAAAVAVTWKDTVRYLKIRNM